MRHRVLYMCFVCVGGGACVFLGVGLKSVYIAQHK